MLIDFSFADGSTDQAEGYSGSEYADRSADRENSRAEIFGLIEEACVQTRVLDDLLSGGISKWSDVNDPLRVAYFKGLDALSDAGITIDSHHSEYEDWAREQDMAPRDFVELELIEGAQRYILESKVSQAVRASAGLSPSAELTGFTPVVSDLLGSHYVSGSMAAAAISKFLVPYGEAHAFLPSKFDPFDFKSVVVTSVEGLFSEIEAGYALASLHQHSREGVYKILRDKFLANSEAELLEESSTSVEVRSERDDGYEVSR